MNRILLSAFLGVLISVPSIAASATLAFSVSGSTAADIQLTVDGYRSLLGTLNANLPATGDPAGRREINWDGVPNGLADPNALPGDFFNGSVAGTARGIEFSTPGTGFEVSANAGGSEAVAFSHSENFTPFSSQRMFRSVGSNILDVLFFDPSDQISAAATRGFGAVFNDVDVFGSTTLSYYDAMDNLFAAQTVRASVSGGLSFAGYIFDDPVIARVRIEAGNTLIPDLAGTIETGFYDWVVMDDFIYGEPIALAPVPLPASALLLLSGIAALSLRRRHH